MPDRSLLPGGARRRLQPGAVSFLLAGAALLLLPSAATAQVLAPADPEAAGLSAPRLDSLARTLRRYVADGQLPGGVLLVARHGRTAWLDAFGHRDRESGEPMAEDDLFRIASQTKALVSVAAMRLVEEGRLGLDDTLGRWIPAFDSVTVAEAREGEGQAAYEVVPARRAITVRHLLTHTSGLGYGQGPAADRWEAAGIQGWYFADREQPVSATVERMAALPLDAHPGERWVYGYSTDVLGVVVERASGLRLDAALRAYVLAPLGMDDTWFYPPPEEAGRLAAVYSAREGGLERAPDPGGMAGQGRYVEGPRASFSGGAGLVSTARDYARFLQMLLDGGALDGVRLLSPGGVAAMTRDHLGGTAHGPDLYGGEARGFGLGFEVVVAPREDDPRRPGAFGWGGAYHSTYWVDPAEELVVVYLAQLIPAGDVDDQEAVRRGVYEALQAPGPGGR